MHAASAFWRHPMRVTRFRSTARFAASPKGRHQKSSAPSSWASNKIRARQEIELAQSTNTYLLRIGAARGSGDTKHARTRPARLCRFVADNGRIWCEIRMYSRFSVGNGVRNVSRQTHARHCSTALSPIRSRACSHNTRAHSGTRQIDILD